MSETSYYSDSDGEKKESGLIDDNLEEFTQEINRIDLRPTTSSDNKSLHKSESFLSVGDDLQSSSSMSLNNEDVDEDKDYLRDPEWLCQRTHIFILSSAGKPIYSLHGSEDKLASLFGVMQALVSTFQLKEDSIKSIQAGNGLKFVFLIKIPIILLGVTKTKRSVQQIEMQLK